VNSSAGTSGELVVRRPGPLTTVQDLGRPGYAHLGVPPSGALDADALRLANSLVGNSAGTAGLELTFGGLIVLLRGAGRHVALTGAPAPLSIDGEPAPVYTPIFLADGAALAVGRPAAGLRSYLAVAGGLTPPPVLGSRSTDLLSGLGPARLTAGTRLPLGEPGPPAPSTVDTAAWAEREPLLRLHPGPRADWFTAGALQTLTGQPYQVGMDSNRIGLRLHGAPLGRRNPAELPSEGLVTGALQVPASGQPVLFLADHPTTGGYPVIGVVDLADLAVAAQARPGATLRFALA